MEPRPEVTSEASGQVRTCPVIDRALDSINDWAGGGPGKPGAASLDSNAWDGSGARVDTSLSHIPDGALDGCSLDSNSCELAPV